MLNTDLSGQAFHRVTAETCPPLAGLGKGTIYGGTLPNFNETLGNSVRNNPYEIGLSLIKMGILPY